MSRFDPVMVQKWLEKRLNDRLEVSRRGPGRR